MNTPDFSDGVMVALKVPAGTASRLALPDGTPPDEMHCTLAYLGSSADLTPEQRDGVVQAAREVAHDAYPLEGTLPTRVGTFPPSPDGDDAPTPYWADPGAPGVAALRDSLLRSLALRDLDGLVSTDHPFNPHVTLAYLSSPDEQPDPQTVPQPQPFTFTQLVVKVGPDTYTFPLGSPHVDSPDPEQDLLPAPVIVPPAPSDLGLVSAARQSLSPQVEQHLRRSLEAHNSQAPLGCRTTIEVLRAVYVRGATKALSASVSGPTAPSPTVLAACGVDRVDSFLAALSTHSTHSTPDHDLLPPAPRRSQLHEAISLADQHRAHDVRSTLVASLLAPSDSPERAFALARALAQAVTSPSPAARAFLPDRLRALLADGNSRVARSLRARRQLRDRYGRWIEMGGGVRYKIRKPGSPGGGDWYHGTVIGQDVPNGLVNVRLDDGSEVAVPADKIEQPLALLHAPGGQPIAMSPQDENAPTVTPKDPVQDDTGVQPDVSDTLAAIEDAGKELRRRVGDDSTEAHHRDALLQRASNAPSTEDLAALSEYADTVARGNAGRMTPEERDAFAAYAEDLQDIVAAQVPTQEPVARLPKPAPTPAPASEPSAPDVPVDVAPSPEGLPELHEFDEAAQEAQAAWNEIDPDSEARDRVAAINNVFQNLGEDFLAGDMPADQAADALQRVANEVDGIIDDHFDELGDGGEDALLSVQDHANALRAKIEAWNAASPSPPTPDAPASAPDAPTPTPASPARQSLLDRIEGEERFLADDPAVEDDPARLDALHAVRDAVENADALPPEEQMRAIDDAFQRYQQELPDPDEAYSLDLAIERYRDSQGIQAPPNKEPFNPWASPDERAQRSSEPEPEPTPQDVKGIQDEITADPLNAERVEFEDARADYENGLLPDNELVPKIQDLMSRLQDADDAGDVEAGDLHDEIRMWFNNRSEPGRSEGNFPLDRDGQEIAAGDWVEVDDGAAVGRYLYPIEDGVHLELQDGSEVNVRVTPDKVRKLSGDEVEALGRDPGGRDVAPAPAPAPEGETDQFGNVVPGRMVLGREHNLPGGKLIQVYNFDDDPNGESKVDVAVGPDNSGNPRYVVRYRNTSRSNHDNWDDAVAAAQAERERVGGVDVENRARQERADNLRQEQEQARNERNVDRAARNVDEADRPLPDGWRRETTQEGFPVMVGPDRYRVLSDEDGQLHLMVRDNRGGFAQVGTGGDWDEVQALISDDTARRAATQRDNAGEWMAGHGFDPDTVARFRVNANAEGARDLIKADPHFQEMARAKRDADDADVQTARQRQAAQDWADLMRHMNEIEDLPAPSPNSPTPTQPQEADSADLSPAQRAVVDGLLRDLEANDEQAIVDAISSFLEGDPSGVQALDSREREQVHSEIIGRAQQALDRNEVTMDEATRLVDLADSMYNENLPNDPNQGLIEPIRAEPETPPPPAPADAAPGAPPGQEGRYHPDGVIQDRAGAIIQRGARVQARRDGAFGEVVAVQQQPPYARIRFDDGRVMVRAGGQLNVVNANQPDRPRPIANQAPPSTPEPARPAAPRVDPAQVRAAIADIREGIPRRIGRGGHGDPQLVARRNAGFALDDAMDAIDNGNMDVADRHLVRAIQRLGFADDEANQLSDIRRQLSGQAPAAPAPAPAPAAPAAPAPNAPNAGPGAQVQGRESQDWLVPHDAGNVADRPLNPTAAGVRYGDVPTQVPDAASPDASVDDFSAWGDRAGEIAQAARTRPSINALTATRDPSELTAIAARIFNADGTTQFGSKGYTVSVSSVSKKGPNYDHNGDHYEVQFSVKDGDGNRVPATLTRTLVKDQDTGRWYLYNEFMRFESANQGSGFAQAWNRHQENWAVANGFSHVGVHAALDKGALVWALNGFDWDPKVDDRGRVGVEASKMLDFIRPHARTEAERRQVQSLQARISAAQNSNDRSLLPTPIELALVGWRPGMGTSGGATWAGHRGMQRHGQEYGKDWHGVKPLDPTHKVYAQQAGWRRARAADERARSGENSAGQVSGRFVHDLVNGQYVDLKLTPTETAEVADVLTNNRSLAVLAPETKRKLSDWVKDSFNQHGGDSEHFESQYNLFRALRGEQAADMPPAPFGVGEELQDIRLRDMRENNVPGWDFKSMRGAGGGVNDSFIVTHNASGQVFYVKSDTYGGRADQSAGRNSEADVNQLLRGAGPGGWIGINESRPSRVEPTVIIQQRVGDNLDIPDSPGNRRGVMPASGAGLLSVRAVANGDSPDAGLRMLMLDLTLGNRDRHNGNWMVAQDASGRGHVFPIDHGLAGGGNGWALLNQTFSQRLTDVTRQGLFQNVKQALEKYDGHSVEYMARQILEDYKASVAGGSVWYDPRFRANVTKSLAEIETNLRKLLRKLGH